jgi:P27 family predicted phage terminase small subunit
MSTTDNADRPQAPPEITGEALLEWERICQELAAAGRLAKADRSILVLYCETWEVYRQAMHGVQSHGAIVKFANGVAGKSPFYTVSREAAAQLQKLLADMGLTPAARSKLKAAVADVPAELEI